MSTAVADERHAVVSVAIPCRADEPSLGRVIDEVVANCQRAPFWNRSAIEVIVCINGVEAGAGCGPLDALRSRCATHGIPLSEVSVDDGGWPAQARLPDRPLSARVLLTGTAGKARAWNLLRGACVGDPVFMCDADVTFSPDAFARLYAGLSAAPHLTLFSPKTDCRHGGKILERIVAVPYRIDFPNLSAQLYAMHPDRVPQEMPENLIEPERWLELEVGPELLGHDRDARVYVRLTATLADFFRQRVRIEMGKIQLEREYPEVVARSVAQPGRRAAWRLTPRERGGLAVYLVLRTLAHVWAWWRYRRGRLEGVWRQAATTKRLSQIA